MRLASYSYAGGPVRLGAITGGDGGGRVIDLAEASRAYRDAKCHGGFLLPANMRGLLDTGDTGLTLARKVLEWVVESGYPAAPLENAQLSVPVPNPPKILALAGNYQDHILEGGGSVVDKDGIVPMLFMKPATTLCGHQQPLVLPTSVSKSVDWELELAAVIGRRAKYVSEDEALDYVAGYTIFNDISSRALEISSRRRETGPRDEFFDWLNGKWQDGYALMGPALVTSDEIPDPQNLSLRLEINKVVRQEGSSAQMIFSVAETIAWASKLVTLEPGDIIATGTPAGVGAAKDQYLKPGDQISGEIEGLGALVNPVIAE